MGFEIYTDDELRESDLVAFTLSMRQEVLMVFQHVSNYMLLIEKTLENEEHDSGDLLIFAKAARISSNNLQEIGQIMSRYAEIHTKQ